MSPDRLQDAIGNIDDKFIDEAASVVRLHTKIWLPAASIAACVLLTVALMPWNLLFSNGVSSTDDPFQPNNSLGILQNEDTTKDTGEVTCPTDENLSPETNDSQNILASPEKGKDKTDKSSLESQKLKKTRTQATIAEWQSHSANMLILELTQ